MQNHSASFQAASQLQGKNSLALQWRPSDTQPLPLQGPQLSRAHQLQSSRHSQTSFVVTDLPNASMRRWERQKLGLEQSGGRGAVFGGPFFSGVGAGGRHRWWRNLTRAEQVLPPRKDVPWCVRPILIFTGLGARSSAARPPGPSEGQRYSALLNLPVSQIIPWPLLSEEAFPYFR